MSFLHSGHGGHSHGGNHGGHDALGGHQAISHSHGHAKIAKIAKGKGFRPWWAISPFDILAYCTGAGAVGEILRQAHVATNLTLGAAVVGALFFNLGLAKPLLGLLLRFESRQSDGLEGQVSQRGEALTRFDAQGRGLVRLALDGQVVQVLAILDADERDRGVRVAKGDPLLVLDVDAAKNTCRVTRELAS